MYSDGHLIGNAFGLSGAARQRLAYVKGVHWSSASWENFRPCQSNRCYTIELKIGESDYVRPPNNPTKFGEIRISGGIYRFGDFFISLIFFVIWRTPRPNTAADLSVQKTRFRARTNLFVGKIYTGYKFRGVLPQTRKIAPGNRVSHVKFKVELRENG